VFEKTALNDQERVIELPL